jgi:hypothetical protein
VTCVKCAMSALASSVTYEGGRTSTASALLGSAWPQRSSASRLSAEPTRRNDRAAHRPGGRHDQVAGVVEQNSASPFDPSARTLASPVVIHERH